MIKAGVKALLDSMVIHPAHLKTEDIARAVYEAMETAKAAKT